MHSLKVGDLIIYKSTGRVGKIWQILCNKDIRFESGGGRMGWIPVRSCGVEFGHLWGPQSVQIRVIMDGTEEHLVEGCPYEFEPFNRPPPIKVICIPK